MFSRRSFLAVITRIMLSVLLLNQVPLDTLSATCTGTDHCHACKNCKYCKHCAKEGGNAESVRSKTVARPRYYTRFP
jgi:hypothetical protein